MKSGQQLLNIFEKYKNHIDFGGDNITDINQKGIMDDTILHIASRQNNIDDIKILIEHNANNIQGDLGFTAIQYACMCDNIEVVKLLLNCKANPLIKNEFGQNALDITKLANKKKTQKKFYIY